MKVDIMKIYDQKTCEITENLHEYPETEEEFDALSKEMSDLIKEEIKLEVSKINE